MTKTVAVTGANGYVGSHLIKKLLEKGYKVVGTVRSLKETQKFDHLLELPNSKDNLKLVEASFEEEQNSFVEAFKGVECIFHVASVVSMNAGEDIMVDLVLKGTEKILQAAEANKDTVKNFIFTSTCMTVFNNFDKSVWQNFDPLIQRKYIYGYGKLLAEQKVHEFCQKQEWLNYACILPTTLQGPTLCKNGASLILKKTVIDIIKGENYLVGDKLFSNFVSVIDVVDMHINAYEKNIKEGKFIAVGQEFDVSIFSKTLKQICQEEGVEEKIILREYKPEFEKLRYNWTDNKESLELLGREFGKLEDSLREAVKSIKGVYV